MRARSRRANGQTGGWADERVGLGLKAIFHEAGFTLRRPVRLPGQSGSAQGAWECSGVQYDSTSNTCT